MPAADLKELWAEHPWSIALGLHILAILGAEELYDDILKELSWLFAAKKKEGVLQYWFQFHQWDQGTGDTVLLFIAGSFELVALFSLWKVSNAHSHRHFLV